MTGAVMARCSSRLKISLRLFDGFLAYFMAYFFGVFSLFLVLFEKLMKKVLISS